MRPRTGGAKGKERTTGSKFRYAVFSTSLGWVSVLAGGKGLMQVTLPCPSREESLFRLGGGVRSAVWSPGFFADLMRRFDAYFNGKDAAFPEELDPGVGTDFQRSVWRITRLIPYGETRSYRWVAEGLGDRRLARACGQALGKNPLAIIIPCHRVVGSDGGLCGFGGGLPMKEALLRLEGAKLA